MSGTGHAEGSHTASSGAANGGPAVSLGPAPEPPGAAGPDSPTAAGAGTKRRSLRRQVSGDDLGSAFDLALMARTASPRGKRNGRRNRSIRGSPGAPSATASPARPTSTTHSTAEDEVGAVSRSPAARQSPGARLSSHNLSLVHDIRSALDSLNDTHQLSQAQLASRRRRGSAGETTTASSSGSPQRRQRSPGMHSRSPRRSNATNGDDESFWWGGDRSDSGVHAVSPGLGDLFSGGGGGDSPVAGNGVQRRDSSPLAPSPDRLWSGAVPSPRRDSEPGAQGPLLSHGSEALRRHVSPENDGCGGEGASFEEGEKDEEEEEGDDEGEECKEEEEEECLWPELTGDVAVAAAVKVASSPLPDAAAGATTLRAASARRHSVAQALGLEAAAHLLPRLSRARERARCERYSVLARTSAPLALLVARAAATERAAQESLARARRREQAARAHTAGAVRKAAEAAAAAAAAAEAAVRHVQYDRAATAWTDVGGGGEGVAPDPEDVDEAVASVALLFRALQRGWGEASWRGMPYAVPRPWSALGTPQRVAGRVTGPLQRWDRRHGWQDRVCVFEHGRLSLFNGECGPTPDPRLRPRAVLTVAAASISLEPASALPGSAVEGMWRLAQQLRAHEDEVLPARAPWQPAAAAAAAAAEQEEEENEPRRASSLSLAALQRLPHAPSLWSAELETEQRVWTLRFPSTLAAAQWTRLLSPQAADRCPDTAALAAAAGWMSRLAAGRDLRLVPSASTVLGCPAVSTAAEEMAQGEHTAAAAREVFAAAVPHRRLSVAASGGGSEAFCPLPLEPAPAEATPAEGAELAATAVAASAEPSPGVRGEYTVTLTTVPFGLLLRPTEGEGAMVRATRGAAAEDGRVAAGHAVLSVDGEWVADEPFESVVDKLRRSRPPCRVTLRAAEREGGGSGGSGGPPSSSPVRSSSARSGMASDSGGEGEGELDVETRP